MAFKTIVLKIYRPTRIKREIMDQALLNYTRALQYLLDHFQVSVKSLADSGGRVTRAALLKLIDKPAMLYLNNFQVQPFKDSLKIDFASIVMRYIGLKRINRKTGYPRVRVEEQGFSKRLEDLIARYDGGEISDKQFYHVLNGSISDMGRLHPLYFGRYSKYRDYCLLYDEYTGRYYAKLYLMNRKNSVDGSGDGFHLRYVAPGLPTANSQVGKKRFLILPLAFGEYQRKILQDAIEHPEILHTASLVKKKSNYFLVLSVDCSATVQPVSTDTTMGISRDGHGSVQYSVCDPQGMMIAQGVFGRPGESRSELCILANNIVREAVKRKSVVVLEAEGGKGDGVIGVGQDEPMKIRRYIELTDLLRYKLPEAGLPQPSVVSAHRLYNTCPNCGYATKKNRIVRNLFACVECGYATVSDFVVSYSLAKKFQWYQVDKIPIYIVTAKGNLRFFNQILGFEYSMPRDNPDYSPMYYELNLMVHSGDQYENDTRKFAMLKKLKDAVNIRDAVRLVYRN